MTVNATAKQNDWKSCPGILAIYRDSAIDAAFVDQQGAGRIV